MSIEIQSLEQINYKFKFSKILFILCLPIVFAVAFFSYFSISDKVNSIIQSSLKNTNCPATFKDISLGLFLPKIVITDLSLPQSCSGGDKDIFFKNLTINYQLISFSPFGLPFKVETSLAGQNISAHLVQGLGPLTLRLKDQKLDLTKLSPFIPNMKLKGIVQTDLKLETNGNNITSLNLKATSSNFEIPGQTIQGFNLPNLAIKDLFVDIISENEKTLKVNKLILGGTNQESPIRANINGKIGLNPKNTANSSLALNAELAISNSLKESIPLLEMMLQNYEIKDDFYQIKIDGTVGAPSFK